MHGMFAGGVDAVRWRCNQASHGAHINDMTCPLFYHQRQGLTCGLNHTHHVDVELRLNVFYRIEILKPIQPPKSGVVDQYINATKSVDSLLDERLYILESSKIS